MNRTTVYLRGRDNPFVFDDVTVTYYDSSDDTRRHRTVFKDATGGLRATFTTVEIQAIVEKIYPKE